MTNWETYRVANELAWVSLRNGSMAIKDAKPHRKLRFEMAFYGDFWTHLKDFCENECVISLKIWLD